VKTLTVVLLIILTTSININSQVTHIDTTFTVDSVWKGDTLYLYRIRHITVIVDNDKLSNKTDTIKLSNFSPPKIDIVRYNFIAENYHHAKKTSSFKINSISPSIGVGKFNIKNDINIIDTNIRPILYTELGFLLNSNFNNFTYSTGLSLVNYFEHYNYSLKNISIDTNFSQTITPNTFWTVDTVFFLNLDSLLIGDTVWISYYDSNFNVTYDTNNFVNYDTSVFHHNSQRINSINYIEFPIIFGRDFMLKNWQISLQIGLITGVYYRSNFRIKGKEEEPYVIPLVSKVNFYAFGALNINYSFSKRLSIFLKISSKMPLNYNYSVYNTKYKYYSYGLSTGLNIKF